MMLTLASIGLARVSAGERSLDDALGWFEPPGRRALGMALANGIGGATGLLVVFWRRPTDA